MKDKKKTVDRILNFYNTISDNKLDYQTFAIIIPKIALVMKYNQFDDVDLVELIDVLLEFKEYDQLNKINNETIKLMKKMTDNSIDDLEGTLYYPINLKHLLLPYQLNRCDREEDIIFHLSKLELLLELINISFNKEEFSILHKYNNELCELALLYKTVMNLYREKIKDEIILNTIISHLFSIFYFKQNEYNNDYQQLDLLIENSINNYQQFINYCYSEGICENFTKLFLEKEEIKKEYEVCNKLLDYGFNNKEKGMC